MTLKISRIRLLNGAAMSLGLTMLGAQSARADSSCSTVFPAPTISRTDCTSANGDGRSQGTFNAGATLTIGSAAALIDYSGSYTSGLTTGYIESTTVGRGVIRFLSSQPFTYAGTGSTLLGSSAASGATILDVSAPSVTLNSGTLTAFGAGSTALSVTANGAAGAGGITATIDGNVVSAGKAIVLNSTDAAATGNITLTSNAETTISSGAGDAVRVRTNGSGGITVNLAGSVTAIEGAGVSIGDAGTGFFDFRRPPPAGAGGDISLTTAAVMAAGYFRSAISVVSNSATANITIVTNGILQADFGIGATLIAGAANGNIDITSSGAINAAVLGISASNKGTGSVTVKSIGPIMNPTGNGISADTLGGQLMVTAGAVSSSGSVAILARQLKVTGSGSVSVSTSGAISGLGGIEAVNYGTGGVTVATTGLVTAVGGPTINAANINAASTGNIAVTVGAGGSSSPGVGVAAATAGTGAVNVAVNGVVKTFASAGVLGVSTSGAISVTNSAGIFAIGGAGIQTSSNSGNQLINIGAAVSGSGAGIDGVNASSASGSLTVNVTGGNVIGTDDAIFVSGGGVKVVNVSAGRTVAGNFGIDAQGTGATIINNSGTIFGTVDAILADYNAVTLNNSIGATLSGAVRLGGLNDTFNNSGALNFSGASDFGAGIDTINNLAGGVLNVAASTAILGLETLANAGTVSLQNGVASDSLTIAGNYTGTGAARLLLDVNSAGADRLVIGGAASGSTNISLNPLGGVPFINTAGLLLIDAGSATTGAFTLVDNGFSTGLVSVKLEQRGADFFLVATPDVAAFEPLALSNMARDMWYQSADLVTGYAALRRADLGTRRTRPVSLWGQLYASRDRSGDKESITAFGAGFDVDNRIRTTRRGAQLGLDVQPPGTGIVLGATGGYQRAETDLRAGAGGFVAKGYNIGAYLIAGRATGIYAGLLAKFDKNDVRIRRGALGDADGSPDSTSIGLEGEIGYRLAMPSLDLDFGAGLSRVNARIHGFDTGQIGFDFDVAKSLRSRLGARASFGGRLGPYLDGKLFHEYKDDARVTFINGSQRSAVDTQGRGTWGRVEAGIGRRGRSGPIAAVWGEAGDVRGFGAKAGFSF